MSIPSFILESCVLSLWSGFSTTVEKPLQIHLFMQNEPNFPHFSPENEYYTKKRTQFKANSNPILGQKSSGKPNSKPTKPNCFKGQNERFYADEVLYNNIL